MYEHFTDRARSVMQTANLVAHYLSYEYITTEHLLLALIQEESSVAANALNNLGVHWDNVLREVGKIVERGPYRHRHEKLPLTPCVKSVIASAHEEAELLDDRHVGTEHLLLGLVSSKESVSSQVLINLGLTLEGVREETFRLLGREIPKEKPSHVPPVPKDPQPAMERERIRSLERQLWNVRVVLGAVAGALAGALFAGSVGAVLGLLIGGGMASFGKRLPAALLGGGAGLLLGTAHLPPDGGGLAGALLGALTGFLIAEIGAPSIRRS